MSNTTLYFGLVAAVVWGVYVVLLKFAANPKYLGSPMSGVLLGFSIGVLAISIIGSAFQGIKSYSFQSTGFAVAVAAGAVWAVGLTVVLYALSMSQTDVSRLSVIYNMNTLIAVLLGMFLLGEIPRTDSRIQVIIGAMLMIFGAYFVSR